MNAAGLEDAASVNNAAFMFEKHSPVLLKFMEEFVRGYDGLKFGNQGPQLFTRVLQDAPGKVFEKLQCAEGGALLLAIYTCLPIAHPALQLFLLAKIIAVFFVPSFLANHTGF